MNDIIKKLEKFSEDHDLIFIKRNWFTDSKYFIILVLKYSPYLFRYMFHISEYKSSTVILNFKGNIDRFDIPNDQLEKRFIVDSDKIYFK